MELNTKMGARMRSLKDNGDIVSKLDSREGQRLRGCVREALGSWHPHILDLIPCGAPSSVIRPLAITAAATKAARKAGQSPFVAIRPRAPSTKRRGPGRDTERRWAVSHLIVDSLRSWRACRTHPVFWPGIVSWHTAGSTGAGKNGFWAFSYLTTSLCCFMQKSVWFLLPSNVLGSS
jgi:hypothetical protein